MYPQIDQMVRQEVNHALAPYVRELQQMQVIAFQGQRFLSNIGNALNMNDQTFLKDNFEKLEPFLQSSNGKEALQLFVDELKSFVKK